MQKPINIDNTGKTIERVLSIADPSIMESNPTGIEYILIDDYVDPPEVADPSLDINYPMYNKDTKKFYWITVNYQNTATDMYVALETANANISEDKNKINSIDNRINPATVTVEENRVTNKMKIIKH